MLVLRRPLLWAVVLLLASGAGGLAAWAWLGSSVPWIPGWPRVSDKGQGADKLDVYNDVPDFSLVERSGQRITRADFIGRVWVANFIYTQCTETCPLQTARLARLQSEFAAEEALRLVSITVDPQRDTPAVLSRYAERYGADPVRWLFLTGEKGAIYRLAKEGFRLGVADPDDASQATRPGLWLEPPAAWASHRSKGLILHSPRLVVVDRRAKIRAYHRPDDEEALERLSQNVRLVLREGARGR